ncbi:MAG: hypothetical protein N2200_00345 [Bacteroidia bacterium]|nr:hypothetical protein [Bacteroidia bacterium]
MVFLSDPPYGQFSEGYSFSELLFIVAVMGILILTAYELFMLSLYYFSMAFLQHRKYRIIRRKLAEHEAEFTSNVMQAVEREDVEGVFQLLKALDEELDRLHALVQEENNKIRRFSERLRKVTWLVRPLIK